MTLRHVAPLNTTFMVTAIIGFIFSTLYVAKYDLTWGITFALIFFAQFVASVIAMERATPDDQLTLVPIWDAPRPKKRK